MFRKTFNKTPHQYLTQRRIERAKQLLAESSLSVTEVCFEVGFESVGSFCSLFHKHVGYPPHLFRTQMAKRKQTVARRPELAVPSCFLKMFAVKTIRE
jgi:AraC-like DNA-binding protein